MGVIGTNGRGAALAPIFAKQENTEVNFICDVDVKARQKGIEAVVKAGKEAPKGENDFRKILANKEVDAIYIATPDHWHAPATIIGCAAGKHVYVENHCRITRARENWLLLLPENITGWCRWVRSGDPASVNRRY